LIKLRQSGFLKNFVCALQSSNPYIVRYWSGEPLLRKERIEGYRACGRYLGLALWFKQTLPFKVCRHVWKFLLKRQLCWADLAFYNADLYEGLRATLNDARWMTEDEFAEVYGKLKCSSILFFTLSITPPHIHKTHGQGYSSPKIPSFPTLRPPL